MKMKTKLNVLSLFVILGFVILLSLVSTVSAGAFTDKKISDKSVSSDMSSFIKEGFNEKYGVIKVSKSFLWIPTDKVAEYSLTSNTEQCLINCQATGKAILYSSGKLFDNTNFKDRQGNLLTNVYSKYYIKVNESYDVDVPTYKEVCKDLKNDTKGKENKTQCEQEVSGTTKEKKTREVWKEYNGETLNPGNYEWRLEGTKYLKQSVDFVPVKSDLEFSEWAWWDSNWNNKKQVNVTGGTATLTNFTAFVKVPYTAAMRSDFGDVRFLNSSETGELLYQLDYFNATEAGFWVKFPTMTTGVNTIYMYYGNPSATTTSNPTNVWSEYLAVYNMNNGLNAKDTTVSILNSSGAESAISYRGGYFGNAVNITTESLQNTTFTSTTGFDFNLYTIEGWYNPNKNWNSGYNAFRIIDVNNGRNAIYYSLISGGNIIEATGDNSNAQVATYATDVSAGTWHYFAITKNASGNFLYYEGVLRDAKPYSAASQSNTRLRVAGGEADSQVAQTKADNIRIGPPLLPEYIARNYQNVNGSNVIFGAEQLNAGLTVVNSQPANASIILVKTITFGCNLTGVGSTNVTSVDLNVTGPTNWTQTITGLNQFNYNATFVNSTVLNGNYLWYCIGHGSGGFNTTSDVWKFSQLAYTPPNVTFNSQIPADIDSNNVMGRPLNITYNITSIIGLNFSTVNIFFKSNSTTRDTIIFVNGTGISGYNFTNYTSNSSDTYLFRLDDNNIYPATYNLNEDVTDVTLHSLNQLTSSSSWVAIQFENVTNTTAFNFLEIMSNSSASQLIYYCNNSYNFATNPATNTNCFNFNTIPAGQPYNHTHSVFSSHQVVPMVINTTTGQVGTIKVTPISYLLLRGNSGAPNVVNYFAVPQTTRQGAIRVSTTGGAVWTNQTYTIDSHLHQFSGNSSLYYYVCANDTNNNQNCSSVRQDLFDLAGLPPTAPSIYSPINQTYAGVIPINYTESISPNGYPITNYNITLWNSDNTFNQTIILVNNLSLGYLWNSSQLTSGAFFIRVRVNDSINQQNVGTSATFSLDNLAPVFNYSSETTPDKSKLTYRNIIINVSASDASPMNITEKVYNSTFVEVGSSVWNNNNTGSFFYNFTAPYDGTFYFNATVVDIYGNNIPSFFCFQEFANVSTSCGGFATGEYGISGSWTNGGSPLYDGNYNTNDFQFGGGTAFFYINYTKPLVATSALWQIKDNVTAPTTTNYTIPESCFSYNSTTLFLRVNATLLAGTGHNNYDCYNGTWNNIITEIKPIPGSGQIQFYEEAMNWNIPFAPTRNVSIDTQAPSITITQPVGNVVGGQNLTLAYNIVETNPDTCLLEYQGVNTTIPCLGTSFSFVSNSSTNLTVWANDTFGFLSHASTNWTYSTFQNSVTFNATTYETSVESFIINISSNGLQPVTASLIYNGTTYPSTKIGNDTEMLFTNTLDIAIVPGVVNKSFYWNISFGPNVTSTQTYNQTINPIVFSQCNSTNTVTFLNFTFKNENTLANINASWNPLVAVYYLGTGTVSKTLNYINLTENPNYEFCFSPPSKTLTAAISSTYLATGFPARLFANAYTLTNSTTNQLLYLLAATDGIPVFIQVIDSQGNKISGALVTASHNINGNPTQVAQDTTGSDGGVSFFLSPNYLHTVVASKSGCSTTVVTFTPSQPQYTLTMNCGGNFQSNNYFQSSLTGITWTRGPLTGILYIPANGTTFNFTYRVQSQLSNIVGAKFVILNQTTNSSGEKLIVNSSTSSCTPSGCSLNLTYFVHPNEILWGRYYVDLGPGYTLLEGDAKWNAITNQPSSTNTVKSMLSDFGGLFESWTVVNGEWIKDNADAANKQEYSRLVFFFLSMAVVLSLFAKFSGYDYPNPGFLLVGLTVIMFILSIYNGVGGHGFFYYSNLIPEVYNGASWLNNYILPLICLLLTVGIISGVMANKRG